MVTEAKSTNYWISSTALYIQLNAMGEPDYIQCSVVSGASILCYMSDVPGLGYDAGHNYQRWPLVAYPSIFPDSKKKYIYAAIPRVRKGDNDIATVVFPSQRIDIYGKAINEQTKEGGSKELVTGAQIGNENFYYIYLQGIISKVKTDADGQTRIREWEQHVDCGSLATDEALASGGEGSWWKFNSVSDTISFLKTILQANFEELTAKDAKIIKLGLNGKDLTGVADETTLENSNTTVVTPQYLGQFGVKHFLAKDKDDTAKGTITFEKVQRFLKGLLVGNSNSENGGSWTPDAEGRSHLITDYLDVRMKAIFEELAIKKNSTIGGKEIISPAGGVAAYKVDEVTVTYNDVSQKAYRCYFLAEQDGDKINNDFVVEDQVRSESFNLNAGKYHKTGNHFFWRMVIGIDEEPVELDGKKYHYIDLSETDCATGSDVPMKGDVLSQCGNRSDPMRQSCLVFSSVDTYAPCLSLYHGINSYSLNNKDYVEYGVDKSGEKPKAFFHSYGDAYIGDRPTKDNNYEGDSYIKYDSEKKKVTIKAELSIKSTFDGKSLEQQIKDNAPKGLSESEVNTIINNSQVIADLQNQVDGAIETWFYEGVPTLVNKPASDWKTDKDKDTHLGDLYYDNKTGKAYRFAKDGNTYKWTIITDTDIAKALSDASKAQETADGKMKVFSTQPTPPYQVGDIWVNATYPSDGSTYKNEVLRCLTDKKAGSQFAIADWIKASKYTDDTVANAAKKAAEEAQKAAQTAQTDITNLGKTVTTNKKAFDSYVTDGYLEPSEIAAMAQDSKRLEDDFAAAEKSYNEVKGAEVLKSTKELTDLNAAFTTLTTAKTELITFLSGISARYNATDSDGKKAIYSRVATLYDNFQTAYDTFYNKLGLASAYITSTLIGKLNAVIGDVASYNYLKGALSENASTDINGGLILSSLIALRDPDTGYVESGINGVVDNKAKGNGIATWWGGYMNDGQVVGFDEKNDVTKQAATSLIRFDGSGYLANGAIYWSVDGKVHADPTSFIISEKNLGAYLTFFEPTWKAGSAGTSVADLVSLKPNAPFSKLGVSGDATFEGAITFHGIKLTYDATNKAIKVDGNLYATGGITAYGEGSGSSGGGGLNGSVMSYSNALKLTSESLSEIASAYSIKALDSRISSLEGGSATAISVSGSGNAVTSVTKNGTTISVVKGSTFLTSHQSLDGYVNAIAVSGSGNAVTAVTKSGKTITFTKGATYLTSHQSLSAYLTKSEASSTYQPKGNYLTSHQSLSNYYTKNEVNNIANGKSNVGHTHQYITDGSMTTITGWNNEVNFGGSNDSSTIYFSYRAQGNKPIITDFIFGSSTGTATVQAAGFKINGGSSSQFLKADGSIDNNTYLTSHQSLTNYYTKDETDSKLSGYLPLSGGTMLANARITHGAGNLYIGNPANDNWLAVQDICSQNSIGDGNWSIRVDGTAHFQSIKFPSNRLIAQVSNGSNSPLKGIKLPSLESDAIGIFSRTGNGSDEGGIVLSEDTCVIYNSFDSGWGLSVRDKDLNQTDISSDDTVAFGIRQTYKLYSRGGFEKKDSSDEYVLLGGGGHSKITDLSVSNADTVDGVHIEWAGSLTSASWLTAWENNGSKLRAISPTNINAGSATKLQTSRTIWGQAFDGTGNVDGELVVNGGSVVCGIKINSDISEGSISFNGSGGGYRWVTGRYSDRYFVLNSNNGERFSITNAGNVGIGDTSPGYKLCVSGDIYSKNTIRTSGQNQAIVLSNFTYPAWISALNGQVIFNTGNAIRFGETDWDWNQWAGLKYNHSKKTIYLGIADGSVFNANSAQTGGTLSLQNIHQINMMYNAIDNIYCVLAKFNSNDKITLFDSDWNANINSAELDINCSTYIIDGSLTIVRGETNGYKYGLNLDDTTITCNFGYNAPNNNINMMAQGSNININSYGNIHLSAYMGAIFLNKTTNVAGNLHATGGVTAYQSSDVRLKQNLRKLDYLGIIRAMGGTFGFAWKKDGKRSIGWIAQHVLQNPHLKDIVETDENGYYKINYWSPKLIATAFGAIEQVGDEVSRLKARVVFLESEVQRLSGEQGSSDKKRLDNKNIKSLN